jgi:hypothetical protein
VLRRSQRRAAVTVPAKKAWRFLRNWRRAELTQTLSTYWPRRNAANISPKRWLLQTFSPPHVLTATLA